jgi:signal recognition particle subunit SRP54
MGSILKMIPGMGGMMRQLGDLSAAEGEMKKMRVMINSMTKTERENTKLLKESSRVERIARGSGRKIEDVREFLQKFEQMEKMMVGMAGLMKGGVMPQIPGMGPVKGFRQAPKGASPFGEAQKEKPIKKSPFGKKYF